MAITENEVKEILELLEKAGWQPQLCDTPVPAYESVHAGNPMEPGQEPSDFIMMPKAQRRRYRGGCHRVGMYAEELL